MNIANIEQINSSYLLNDLRNFNEIFKKYVTYNNIKSHKKQGFHPLSRRYIFQKTIGGGQIDPPPLPPPPRSPSLDEQLGRELLIFFRSG